MLKSLNSMDFTVAVASNSMTIEQDMTFIKAALLYSDTITLVSPVASTYIELTDNANKKNEKALYNLMQKVIPFCQKADPIFCENINQTLDQFSSIFYNILKKSVSNSSTFPLFDDLSNNLIKSAIEEKIITLNKSSEFEAKHAKLAGNLLIALPSFEFATTDEILDIRKELEKPLVRFRSKLLAYDAEIQSMPWDEEFQFECIKLYQQEVAPAVLEIDELTKESSFIKNLGYSFLTDKSALEKTGKIFITVAMAGIISAFTDVLSRGQTLAAAGGAYTISKVATAYKEYEKNQHDIMKKDMYFYYRAGKLLEKRTK